MSARVRTRDQTSRKRKRRGEKEIDHYMGLLKKKKEEKRKLVAEKKTSTPGKEIEAWSAQRKKEIIMPDVYDQSWRIKIKLDEPFRMRDPEVLSSQSSRHKHISSVLRSRIHQKKHERAVAANSVIKKTYNLNEFKSSDNTPEGKRINAIVTVVKILYRKISEEYYKRKTVELKEREEKLKEKQEIKETEYHQLVLKLKQRSKLKNSAPASTTPKMSVKPQEVPVAQDTPQPIEADISSPRKSVEGHITSSPIYRNPSNNYNPQYTSSRGYKSYSRDGMTKLSSPAPVKDAPIEPKTDITPKDPMDYPSNGTDYTNSNYSGTSNYYSKNYDYSYRDTRGMGRGYQSPAYPPRDSDMSDYSRKRPTYEGRASTFEERPFKRGRYESPKYNEPRTYYPREGGFNQENAYTEPKYKFEQENYTSGYDPSKGYDTKYDPSKGYDTKYEPKYDTSKGGYDPAKGYDPKYDASKGYDSKYDPANPYPKYDSKYDTKGGYDPKYDQKVSFPLFTLIFSQDIWIT
eukprot:TRINITY_DN3807_c0_g1_i5.p1 TRINITY_DN3807_c0_g1~~TRINITY_DN3807_c0_g1_i5.p1  ORF type:complete len:517 (+),score=120.98 TRINITY_DN3807_c0_g1_i5:193-1743(+)